MKFVLTSIVALLLFSCGDKPAETKVEGASKTVESPLASVFTKTKPEGAISITEAKKSIKVGETITIKGEIGGRQKPFAENVALFIFADGAELDSCPKEEGCPTPWDYCCYEPDDIAAASVTIQVMDKDGKLIKKSLKGQNGLKGLSQLLITGVVDKKSKDGKLILNVTSIYIEQ